ncbi:MAG: hypothetical protein LBP62_07995 [Clostridiales bacterium]|jgi:phosphomannomutase|nr:hypothetical protein [Clostridiales bacterium]
MLFGTDGVRGLSAYFFERNLAYNIGRAVVCRDSRSKKVVIARDTRLFGYEIEKEVIRGLSEYPTEILELSVMPTMTVSEILRFFGADYGIMVSASHNPPEYNGIKIFDKTGQKLTAAEEMEIEREVFSFWENGSESDIKNDECIGKNGKSDIRNFEYIGGKGDKSDIRNSEYIGENANKSGVKNVGDIGENGKSDIRNFGYIGEKGDKNDIINSEYINKKGKNDIINSGYTGGNECAQKGGGADRRGRVVRLDGAGGIYKKILLDRLGARIDGLNIRLDCCFGACCQIAPEIFKAAGANVFALAAEADGSRINVGTGSTNIDYLRANMSKGDFLGCAFDGDGDRMLAVTPDGFVADGDRILYILTLFFKSRGLLKKNTVVGTSMTNGGLEEALKREGVGLIRTDVGDKYVIEKIKEGGYAVGGETSGHIIMNENAKGATGDGILAALMLVRSLAELGVNPGEIASLYAAYPQKTVDIKASAKVKKAAAADGKLNALLKNLGDGIKGEGRILARPSGTEDKIRITVEAKNEKTVDGVLGILIPAYRAACLEFDGKKGD